MPNNKNKIVVFDLCNTLYFSNTTFDFIRFHLQKEYPFRFFIFRILNSRLSPLFVLLVLLNYLFKTDLNKYFTLALIEGVLVKDLEKSANNFVHLILANKKIKEVHELLSEAKKTNSKIIIASASIDVVVDQVAQFLQIKEWVSSTLEVKEGSYTGKLKIDLTDKKTKALKEIVEKLEDNHLTVISDNYSDKPLFKKSQQRFVVLHKKRNKKYWTDLEARFIYV